jgi:glucose-6-phosphate 1-dehydrogenase
MKSLSIILFGGTGDLAKKKILPALSGLINRKVVDKINLIATGRKDLSSNEYSELVGFHGTKDIVINYLQMDFEKKDVNSNLSKLLENIEDETCIGRLFYFAISPKYFKPVAKELLHYNKDKTKFNRFLFEKPFGYDLKSSKSLSNVLDKYFNEENVFRVDHYLGKETVKNILALRLANPVFENTWNSKFVESINIIVSENMGVGNRMEYYNHTGAIRDMIQNHLLQILSFILMDAPDSTESSDIHKQKILALKKLSYRNVKLGQYEGYIDELKAHNSVDSDTETYVKLELESKSKNWTGTKIFLVTGKNLQDKYARIELNYKKEPCKLYCDIRTVPNKLVINVQPKEDIEFYMNTPVPGNFSDIKNVKMNFCKECEFSESSIESYELIIEECIKGEKTLFIDKSELETAWKLVDKIRLNISKPIIYSKGVDALKVFENTHS